MFRTKKWWVLAGVALSMSATALGGYSGGGGNAVVCFDNPEIPVFIRDSGGEFLDQYVSHVTSIEMFDLYEAKLPHGLNGVVPSIIPAAPGATPVDYAKLVSQRFERVVPQVSEMIKTGLKRFSDDKIIIEPHGLQKFDDTDYVGLIDSKNCVLATMAAQQNSEDDFYLHIDGRLFNHPTNSVLSKAVLFLHEITYMRARELGQTDSRNTRALVGMMITENNGKDVKSFIHDAAALGLIKNGNYAADPAYAHQLEYRAMSGLVSLAQGVMQDFKEESRDLGQKVVDLFQKDGANAAEAIFACPTFKLYDSPFDTTVYGISQCMARLRSRGMSGANEKVREDLLKKGFDYQQRLSDALAKKLNPVYDSYYAPLILTIPGVPSESMDQVNLKLRFMISKIVESAFDDFRDPYELSIGPGAWQFRVWDPEQAGMDFLLEYAIPLDYAVPDATE